MDGYSQIINNRRRRTLFFRRIITATVILSLMSLFAGSVFAANLRVLGVNKDGSISRVSEYRWLIEENSMYDIQPGVETGNTLAVNLHKSYMTVVAEGDNTEALPNLPPGKYFVSVIPKVAGTYSIGGAELVDNGRATVYLNRLPLPSGQISIFIHEDLDPINNAYDVGERGLEGFRIKLEDAGGRYGISAGEQSTDAFGNPLGTLYVDNCDVNGQNPGSGSSVCLDEDSAPIVQLGPDIDGNGTPDPIIQPLITGADGTLSIKNLAPAKYGVIVIPPNAVEVSPGVFESSNWIQTTTIEGTKVVDAWIKANEPPFFVEFGAVFPHISIGFVPAGKNNPYYNPSVIDIAGTDPSKHSITGQVVNLHLSRPPSVATFLGEPFSYTTPWVGLNRGAAGTGSGVYAARANEDGGFTIPGVPDDTYELVIWDDNLDIILGIGQQIIVNGGNVDIGKVGVLPWFTRTENWVYNDANSNGFRDPGETGISEQAVNIRWRDGSLNQSAPTDGEGFVPFDEIFPFFSWMVAEVDYARFKATGLTVTVDDGGEIDLGDPWSWEGVTTPQDQRFPADPSVFAETDKYRTEQGVVLTQGMLGFISQTSVFEWGKQQYGPGENGGISGVVYYAVTRAEDDPEQAAWEPWEPGIPRVTVNLYAYDTSQPNNKGAMLATTTTDSWDDSIPTGCKYGVIGGPYIFKPGTAWETETDCFDGLRNWNQVRPGVFDGGYAFDTITYPSDPLNPVSPIPPGRYIVEVVPPTGYGIIQSQDKNVDFGDSYIPVPQLLPPECVGPEYTVPAELTLFPGVEAGLAGQTLNNCDAKLVSLTNGANAAADFFLFTNTPVASHIMGAINSDTTNTIDPNSPQFGEKYAPPWLPVGIRDWTGRLITSSYSDEFGKYNLLVPSTYTANLPQPSGMSPNMLIACMNDKEADGINGYYNPSFNTACYTLNFMPGTTTYLDTPVVPLAAFAGPGDYIVDCEFVSGTPRIATVTSTDAAGPYIAVNDGSKHLTITSLGEVSVTNPEGTPAQITRDYGFGDTAGTVEFVNTVTGAATLLPLSGGGWSNTTIDVVVPGSIAGNGTTGHLRITRGDNGQTNINSVTLQVGLRDRATVRTVSAGQSIQAAIDAARTNDLILVGPGVFEENVIMWKPVQLQGSGEATVILAQKTPSEKLVAWKAKAAEIVDFLGSTDGLANAYVPGQGTAAGGVTAPALFTEEGSGVLVLATSDTASLYSHTYADNRNLGARIDGFIITGGDTGGAIVVNGHANSLTISNNRLKGNSGFFTGGVRVGHPGLSSVILGVEEYTDSDNDNIILANNYIGINGAFDGAGGGVSICNGSDNYKINGNFVCGNFTLRNGPGIAHYGRSTPGEISDNTIIFNENFNQGVPVNGGGISVEGYAPLAGQVVTEGSGDVTIFDNIIQGNNAGSGNGAGIFLNRINGADVAANLGTPANWYTVDITNNMIFNNVAALSGAGIFMQDTLRGRVLYNSIINNDNTSTGASAFTAGVTDHTTAQLGAGIATITHSLELSDVISGLGEAVFSNPVIENNIIQDNRVFTYVVDSTSNPGTVAVGLCPNLFGIAGLDCSLGDPLTAADPYPAGHDLAVYPLGGLNSLTASAANNLLSGAGDPLFVASYFNTDYTVAPAADEGGNFISARYKPLTQTNPGTGDLYGDLHIGAGAANGIADVTAGNQDVADDIDGDPRSQIIGPDSNDAGADEN